jgi:oligoendopeptidase F
LIRGYENAQERFTGTSAVRIDGLMQNAFTKRPRCDCSTIRNRIKQCYTLISRESEMPGLTTKTKKAKAAHLGSLPEWDLSHLYASPEADALKADIARLEADAAAFAKRAMGKLSKLAVEEPDSLAGLVSAYEAIQDLAGKIGSYAGLRYAADTSDPARAKFYGDINETMTRVGSALLFFELELNRIEDAVLDGALTRSTRLTAYKSWLIDLRRERPHQLADELEQLFLEKSVTSAAAFNRLFDETMTGLRFHVGKEELTLEPALNKLQDPDASVRKAWAMALSETFRSNIRLFTLITNTLAKDKEISDRWRKFTGISDARHLANRVEPEVVEALVSAVREAYPRLSHRYYALKAKWFGQSQLEFWDRNAPLPKVEQDIHSWSEARDIVLDAYGRFAPEMAEVARRFFDEQWIDAGLRSGKSPGAFAHPTVPSAHPYVLINYQGRPRDVMTLAHELGHGVHQVLAGHNGALMAPTPLTLAETASVFGEMLTFRNLLAAGGAPERRKALLAQKVEDMINTVVRQIAFYTFEMKLHTERRQGELTSERLNQLWMDVQVESLGPAVRLTPAYDVFWAYIPHFIHSPFYVYAYAFGDCLVNSLYAVYEKAEPGFVEKYFAMLKAGGTKHHSELLAPFGLDARDPAFWQLGLGVIEDMIVELEGMA